jgi:hypothetical protein
LDTGEGLDRGPRGGHAADGLQLGKKCIAVEGDLHDELLIRDIEVIGMKEVVEKSAFLRT